MENEIELFQGTYVGWRQKRISKIESIFTKEFFKNKTILELGCGYGDTGKYFIEKLGAKVTFGEGDGDFIEKIRSKNPNHSGVHHLDQDKKWDLKQRFDVIIHWGVLYHLDNWKQDLKCAMKHSDLILLESEVSDSDDKTHEFKFKDHDGYDQAVNKKATRPSASYIESVVKEYGFEFARYDDADLNHERHCYDWTVKNTKDDIDDYGKRRFWILHNPKTWIKNR